MIKIVFFGTPKFVLPVLNDLNKSLKTKEGSPIVAVVTQKPKLVGRKKSLTYTPVDKWAFDREIPKFHSAEEFLKSGIKADVGILAAYGEILSKEVLNFFPHGILNIHGSILPKFRGATPIRSAIISGEKETGATIIKLDEKLDHGPIVTKFKEEISDNDTSETLKIKVFEKAGPILSELMQAYIKGKINLKTQDESEATYCREITKQDGLIPFEFIQSALSGKVNKKSWEIPFMKDFSQKPTAENIYNFVRAMDPWPVAWTYVSCTKGGEKKRLKIVKCHVDASKLIIDRVQLEGKNEVSFEQFKQGYPEASI